MWCFVKFSCDKLLIEPHCTVGRSLYKKFNSAISYITQEEGDGGAEKFFSALFLFLYYNNGRRLY